MAKSQLHLLHHCQFHKRRAILNRIYTLLNILAILVILYYRATFFLHKNNNSYYYRVPLLPWIVVSANELLLSFLWILKQSMYYKPVTRTVFPENLPEDEELLPGIDVFICTADPIKEPTFHVMNTVISAMSLDYPAHKLSVYVSDDGAASVTLNGLKDAWVFATWWLPFCKTYHIKPICPQAYFENLQDVSQQSREFIEDRNIMKEKYENFKQRVCNLKRRSEIDSDAKRNTAQDHPAIIQVVDESLVGDDAATINPENVNMPFLVYVAREKRPSHPTHFKAGALNVLQRVSSILSNSPYILVLDCDMYCNDSISARQAMCFYLDSKMSSSLAWVQFPQKFHNISETDIYDSQMRVFWPVLYPGMDGLQGPFLSGTNFYISRKALYGFTLNKNDNELKEKRYNFGSSNELIRSLTQIDKTNAMKLREISSDYLQEAHYLASCTYEENTQWGIKIGFRYESVVEDVMTGFILHGQGWKSVYLNPEMPQFLGSGTTNLNEALIQNTRWGAGLFQLGLSKYCPAFYSLPRLLILQRMSYIWVSLSPLVLLSISGFAVIPPICFVCGIPLYPKVSDPFFIAYAFIFISSRLKHLWEVCFSSGSVNAWMNEQRLILIKGVTCSAYSILEYLMATIGLRQTSFMPTNKTGDDDTSKWYRIGKYDFRTSNMFLVPIVGTLTLNISSFVGGILTVMFKAPHQHTLDTFFAQLFFLLYVFIISFPVIEGMLFRKDNTRIPLSTSLISILLSWVLLIFGYYLL